MRILLTGDNGFLGQHVIHALSMDVQYDIRTGAGRGDGDYDLRQSADTAFLFRRTKPDLVIHLACPTPGGIGAMSAHPMLCADMVRIDANVVEACVRHKVQQLITVGSVCSFPERAPLPATELDLFNGPPEATNAPYGEAKRFTWTLLEAARREYGLASTYLVLSNVYGPGDRSGHLIPATIRKIRAAQEEQVAHGDPQWQGGITCWGDGWATRDLLYVDDVVAGVLAAIGTPAVEPILLCAGSEVSVRQVVYGLCEWLDFAGEVIWDPTQPVGQGRRCFRSLSAGTLGWHPRISLPVGLRGTVKWWHDNPEKERP